MRNWNHWLLTSQSMIDLVFIVPMRNWNIRIRCLSILLLRCFYRTYEELKHHISTSHETHSFRFYRTYEELKHYNNGIYGTAVVSFYRTYEELKLTKSLRLLVKLGSFYRTYEELKLPEMHKDGAWHMRFYRTYEELKLAPTLDGQPVIGVVFIVPMRNWNRWVPQSLSNLHFLFLSYLWGIETQ